MKILLTKPMIDKYQDEHLPSTKGLEEFSRQLDQLTRKLDSIAKRTGG